MERYRESLLAQGLVDQNWDVVTDIVRGGVSADCREHVLHEAVKACQWECITQLVLQGVSLQHRDMVLKEALRHSQWECATTLVRLGVSANNRDFAFHKAVRYRQWQCVEEVLSLGVSQQQRDFAVRRILRFEQWEFLTELAKAGVCVEQEICSELPEWNSVDELNDITRRLSLEQTKLAMSEVIRQDKWDCVPRLMKLCIHPVVRDSVLRDAVLLGKWDCVTKLVDLGLTEEQRKYVCDEAIVWGQLECAISLLRDGVSSSHTLWIVDESFRQTKWQLLTGLEGWNPTKEAKALLLNTTVTYRQRDAFLDIVQRHGVTDLELTHAMMTAISQSAHAFLHHMIVSTRKGYRVFKQLCLRERWWKVETAVCVHIYLLTVQETDLACYLASAQGMWDSVRNLYGDWRVHARSRHFAFELAVKRGLWEHVVHMVSRGVTRQSDLRFAFLEAIRQRQWCWVMKIVNRDLNLGNSDVRFAVRTCCDECQWDVALDLCQVCDVEVLGVRLAKSVLEHTIRTNALQRFLRLCELWDIAEEPKLLSFILRKALRLQRTDFVTTVIEEFDLYGDDDLEHIAVKSAIDKRNWDFLKELVQREHGGLFTDTLARCIQKMNNRRKQWSKCLPIFEEWCRSYDHFDFIEVMYDTSQRLDMAQAPDLAKWCCVHSLPNIAFIFSIVAAQLPVIKRILKRHKHDIRKEFLAFGFSTACLNGHFERHSFSCRIFRRRMWTAWCFQA
ncbi:hypothetical protein BaRGS_00036097 [Batillaria attramentaria]|uniref:Ankyrin repeat-containing domain n=1 Tax=Batillaria attramentaria TaxID=370345 RepID=A0ABD0JCX4_9CAEN